MTLHTGFPRRLALVALLVATPAAAQKFYPDDPIREDRDDIPIETPGVIELSATYDLLLNTFHRPELEQPIPRALNANTLGEVPDSSWFQNRIGVREMSLEELVRGPEGEPPSTREPLAVIAAKASGITPGFTVRDAEGRIYFVKFDPAEHPDLSTGADVIAKNFFHAIGYNVPAAFILYLRLEDLRIDPEARVRFPGNKLVPMDLDFLKGMLDRAGHRPDGSARAVASLEVPGKVVGPFSFYGTRPDDPNDVVPHQHRRELRGYRLFCAWLNHDDSRAINTLDSYVGEPGRGHLRHYLIDFGSTLGSGSDHLRRIAPQDPRSGNEYIVDFDDVWKAAYSFGVSDRAWRKARYLYPEYPEIGRIEADFFEPEKWKPEYPNPAFDRMLGDDAFWAARIVARFSDEAVRALVSTGDYLSEDAERVLADILIRRRDKVVSYGFRQVNPLADFSVEDGLRLRFHNLGEERGMARVEGYDYQFFSFDNETGEERPLGASLRVMEPIIALPSSDVPHLLVRIRTVTDSFPRWNDAVDVYLRGSRVVGIDREL
jgi:hypothetical protein